MFFSLSCNTGNFLSFPHLIIHPMHEWSWFYRQFQFCVIVSNDEILSPASSWEMILSGRPDLSRSASSFLTDCAVPSRRISSRTRRTFRIIFQEVSSGHPDRSYVLNFSFPLLRRPSTVVIPTLSNLLKRSFPWIAHGNDDRRLQINLCLYQVAPISPLSQLNSRDVDFRNFSSLGLLKSRTIRATASWQ